ncbi:MAG: PrsW family intramembrane metalloprotease [Opitutae bacterium]|nr:PrsW family intramembrane metalloprotease [Opitutae bacterium]
MTESRSRWQQFLSHASRSRSFLWRLVIAFVATGVAVGAILHTLRPAKSYLFGERVLARIGVAAHAGDPDAPLATGAADGLADAFAEELAPESLRFFDVLRSVPTLAPHVVAADFAALHTALARRFDEPRAGLALDFFAAWQSVDEGAFARLEQRAAQPAPLRFTRYAFGRVLMRHENFGAAFEMFAREGEADDATESRYMAVRALVKAKDFARLELLLRDPRYAPYSSPGLALEAATESRRWAEMLRLIPAVQIDSYEPELLLVSAVAGVTWALFLFHLGQVASPFSRTGLLCGSGLLAGVLSTTVTIFLVVVQDDVLGFREGTEIVHRFAYNIGGVGAREELSKLLLFAPLILFLRKRDDELEVLTVACFVGLGFAVEENVSYFATSAAASAPGRFLTANFFHIALTGVNGLALYRACTRGMGGLNDLLLVFPLSILAHGAYDALLDLPQVERSEYFAMIAYVGFCFYFFSRARPLRADRRTTVSLTGAFVTGVALVAATVIAFQMATLGIKAGANLIFSELIGSAALLIVFFHEFDETLTA